MGLLTKTQTRPWVGFLAGTHGLGRALASSTIRGTDISEISVMGVLVKLATHAVTQPHHASKESQEFVKLCLARLVIPTIFLTVCTATEQICNYGDRRLSGASHEVACGLVLPR